ncbi:MAG: translocation/assembly module TamB domain-containing protein [Vulcanimicrobiaceae bacterium]
MQRRRVRLGLVSAVVVTALLLIAFRGPLSRALIAGVLDLASGDTIAFDGLEVRADHAVVSGLAVERGSDPLLDADRVEIRYRLRDLLPGATRRYGLVALDLRRPRLTLVRHADWNTNLAFGGGGGGAPAATRAGATPLRFDATVEDGSLVLLDQTRNDPRTRRLSLDGIGGRLAFDGAERSAYNARAYLDGDPASGLTLAGVVDERRGYALHRLQAPRVPLPKLLNYLINVPSARVLAGTARDVDLRAYALGFAADRSPAYHFGGSAQVEDGAMTLPGLQRTVRDMSGRIDLYDDGVAARRMDAALAGVPMRLCGAIYDWQAPAFRLGVSGSGSLQTLRSLFRFSHALPLQGDLTVGTLVEGEVGSPLVLTRVASAHAAYAGYPIDGISGNVVYDSSRIDLVRTAGRYGPIEVAVDGEIELGDVARSRLFVGARGPAARIPYAAQLAPQATLEAAGVLVGSDLKIDGRGVLAGGGGGTAVAGLFHVDPAGGGAFGPLSVRRDDGASLAGTFYLNRIASESGFWLDARDYPVLESPLRPRLPNLGLAPPDFSGRLTAALAGDGTPATFRVAGAVQGRAMQIGRVRIDRLAGVLAGAPDDTRLGGLVARGPWGSFRGDGGYTAGRLALAGDYRGSFAELASLTGDVGGSGPVEGPVALVIDGQRTVVQARGDRTPGALVRGVPVAGISATFGTDGKQLRVYAARAAVAGGTMAAAGTLGGRGRVGVSLAGLDAAQLDRVAPLGPGRVSALGDYGYEAGSVRFDGGLALGSQVAGLPVIGNGDVRLVGNGLDVRQSAGLVAGAYGTLDGTVVGLGSAAPRYDLGLHVRDAQAGPFARAFYGDRYAAATVSTDLRVAGAPGRFSVAGHVAVPEGQIGGLNFSEGAADVALGADGLDLRAGTVTVGSTRVGFGASLRQGDAGFRLDAPRADLEDFNDLFDAGDTLDGRGRVEGGFLQRGGTARTSADVAIEGLRYRRFDLGDAQARWNSNGSSVVGALAFGGVSGRLDAEGTLLLAAREPFERILERSRFQGRASLRGLDLDVWLPALGYQLPIGGHVDADATIAGSLQAPSVTTDARLVDGHLGRFPVRSLTVSASSTLRRTTVTSAELDLPSLTVTGSGSFGQGSRAPVAFGLHAKSSNVGELADSFMGARYPLTGAAEADVKVDGPLAKPRVAGGFDLSSATVAGVKVPEALGEFSLQGRSLVLSDAEVVFPKGALYLAGSLPLTVAPFALGPASAPITLELAANAIDLTNFAPLLPAGSTVAGVLDGRVKLAGTAGEPALLGELDLAGGALATPFETTPLTALRGRLSFDRNTVALDSLHAAAGSGTLDLLGRATFPELVHPAQDATYSFTMTAAHAALNLPAYGYGQVDGSATLGRVPSELPLLAGSASLSDAVIPFSALLLASGTSEESGLNVAAPVAQGLPAGPNVAFNVQLSALRNVRVRSANVDIGGQGELNIAGTRSKPRLSGAFTSTGGTLTYFNTVFRLIDGTVTFEPENGVIPTLEAHAVTHVINPDPNLVRNSTRSADVSIALNGPVTNLNISFSSDPPYDRQQILGLLIGVPALGATNLFGPVGPTPYGSTTNAALPPGLGIFRTPSGEVSVGEEAFGILNAQFTRNLLAPIESGLGGALGLSSLNVNVDYTGNVGLTARKILGKNVNAVYGTTIGYPYRQTFGFELKPSDATAAQVTVFETLGAYGLDSLTPVTTLNSNQRLTAAQPAAGTVGFSLSLQRLLW